LFFVCLQHQGRMRRVTTVVHNDLPCKSCLTRKAILCWTKAVSVGFRCTRLLAVVAWRVLHFHNSGVGIVGAARKCGRTQHARHDHWARRSFQSATVRLSVVVLMCFTPHSTQLVFSPCLLCMFNVCTHACMSISLVLSFLFVCYVECLKTETPTNDGAKPTPIDFIKLFNCYCCCYCFSFASIVFPRSICNNWAPTLPWYRNCFPLDHANKSKTSSKKKSRWIDGAWNWHWKLDYR